MSTVSVAAPQCSPARYWEERVKGELAKYGTWKGEHAPRVSAREVKSNNGKQVLYIKIDVLPSVESAEWCEYVLLRYGYERVGPYLNPMNASWARVYTNGQAGASWHEKKCAGTPKGALVSDVQPFPGRATVAPPPPWSNTRHRVHSGQDVIKHPKKHRAPGGAFTEKLSKVLKKL